MSREVLSVIFEMAWAMVVLRDGPAGRHSLDLLTRHKVRFNSLTLF